MKVNMTPNPLDVVTIHASQGDTEARQWEFELHNNGELIDTSDVTEQMFFKAYKGGTEQLLPENTSTPTTSPIIADIKYPQGLLTDQEFTYRQSPTEEDGLAKITDIKGNTLVWNQQLNDTGSTTTSNGITFTKNADGSITLNGTATAQADYTFARFDYINGHKYLVNGIPSGATVDGYRAFLFSSNETLNRIITTTRDDWFTPRIRVSNGVTVSNVVFRLNIFDLTKIGLDSITSVGEFTSLFPSYYSYNQGSLLSFMGNGIKTVGFNQWDEQWEAGILNSDGSTSSSSNRIITSYVPVLPNITYSITIPYNARGRGAFYDENKHLIEYFYDFPVSGRNDVFPRDGLISSYGNNYYFSFIPPAGTAFVRYNTGTAYGATYENNICINISDSSKNGTYEPYTSSTLSLPISTYFSNGMKSAGSVYDELAPSKAITRIGVVDLGSLTWDYDSTHALFFSSPLSDSANTGYTTMPNITCASYTTVRGSGYNSGVDKSISINDIYGIKRVTVKDTSYTDFPSFKSAMSGVYLYYELATPTETSFTTASLVTENAEIPLSNEDGTLVGKCTEQLSENPGFIDAKIKLTDSDGSCYSNKIQLHIERSPQ